MLQNAPFCKTRMQVTGLGGEGRQCGGDVDCGDDRCGGGSVDCDALIKGVGVGLDGGVVEVWWW